ncbi:MAG: hypothetical protein QOG85_556 [Gaiellaceae bacterium]|nr:hypothetical protein [Gaiellaceae bacterium]
MAADAQALSEHDQTLSDEDQTWSDRDQTASDRDDASAADDQQAADEDLAQGGDPRIHKRTRLARQHTQQDRENVAELREDTATARLAAADARDRVAEERDRLALARDRSAAELVGHTEATVEERLIRAERDRAQAATDRAHAAEDRKRAAADRERAAHERAEALHAEAQARDDLLVMGTDELTGVWARRVGLASIEREIERARRTHTALVLIFVDVDGLKKVNDSEGHAGGDELLRGFTATLQAHIRPYDIVVRYGGDEFLCAMPNLTLDAARDRIEGVATAFTEADDRHSFGFGLAQYDPPEQLVDLIRRADADLLEKRRTEQE